MGQHRLEVNCLQISSEKMIMRVLADNLNTQQQCTLAAEKANCMVCIRLTVAPNPGKRPFLSIWHLKDCIRVLCPVFTPNTRKKGTYRRRSRQHLLDCVEKLRDPSSSSLKESRCQGDFIASFN